MSLSLSFSLSRLRMDGWMDGGRKEGRRGKRKEEKERQGKEEEDTRQNNYISSTM